MVSHSCNGGATRVGLRKFRVTQSKLGEFVSNVHGQVQVRSHSDTTLSIQTLQTEIQDSLIRIRTRLSNPNQSREEKASNQMQGCQLNVFRGILIQQ